MPLIYKDFLSPQASPRMDFQNLALGASGFP